MAKYIIKEQAPSMKPQLGFTTTPVSSNDLFVIVSRKHPKGEEIISSFNKGLAKLKESGEYDQIISSWFE